MAPLLACSNAKAGPAPTFIWSKLHFLSRPPVPTQTDAGLRPSLDFVQTTLFVQAAGAELSSFTATRLSEQAMDADATPAAQLVAKLEEINAWDHALWRAAGGVGERSNDCVQMIVQRAISN